MNYIFLTIVACVYFFCNPTSSQPKTLIWIQHPDVADYYEHLLDERAKCKKARTNNTTRMLKRIVSMGKKSPKPPSSPLSPPSTPKTPSPQTSDSDTPITPRRSFLRSTNSFCRTAVKETNEKAVERAMSFTPPKNKSHSAPLLTSIPSEEAYRYLRSSSFVVPRAPLHRSRNQALPFLKENTCPFHRKSVVKQMDTPSKQALCDADLIRFTFQDDHLDFLVFGADPENGHSAHPKQSFIDNIPQKKKKKYLFGGKRKMTQREGLVSSPAKENKEGSSSEKKNYVEIFVRTRTGAPLVKAIPCIVDGDYSWSLVDGYAADQYFTVEKNSEENVHYVTGLLDAPASVKLDKNNAPFSSESLEKDFRAMQQWIVKTNSRINLCILDDIQKFRLCSVVYAARQHQLEGTVRQMNFLKTFKDHDCIGNALLRSKDNPERYVSDVGVTLIPCVVNDDKPAFYVTASEDRKNSVFVVSSSVSPSGSGKDYFLDMIVTNINVLRNIQNHSLLVTYKEPSRKQTEDE